MLEAWRGGPWPISLSIEKTQNFDQVVPPLSWSHNAPNFLSACFPNI